MMKKDDKFKKTHPYSFIRNLRVSVVLVVLSFLQQFLFKPQSIVEIIGSLGINALYVFAVLFYYSSSYGNYKYRLEKQGVHIKKGVFMWKDYILPYDRIYTVVFYKNLISSLFGAEKISVDTPGGFRKNYDISEYFSRKTAIRIKKLYKRGRTLKHIYSSRIISIILMSAFWSNPVTGIVFIVPVIINIEKVIGSQFTQDIVRGTMNTQWSPIAKIISPAAAAVASLILVSWTISMLICFLRYVRLRSSVLGEHIIISRGIISQSVTVTRTKGISTVSIEQSLLMRILRLQSCAVSVIGSGKLKGDKGLIIAGEDKTKVHNTMTKITGIPNEEEKRINAVRGGWYSYIYSPAFFLAGLIVLTILSDIFFPLHDSILFLITVFYFILIWWLLFRIFAYRHSHLGINKKTVVLCSYDKLTLKKRFIPFDMIRKTEISQNPMQIKKGRCNLSITVYGEKKLSFKIKQLPVKETKKLIRSINKVRQ